jgi:hypothetical protein
LITRHCELTPRRQDGAEGHAPPTGAERVAAE